MTRKDICAGRVRQFSYKTRSSEYRVPLLRVLIMFSELIEDGTEQKMSKLRVNAENGKQQGKSENNKKNAIRVDYKIQNNITRQDEKR